MVVGGAIFYAVRPARAGPGDVTLVAVDTTTAGNDDSAIGTIDSCASINVGETLVFDLIIQGVDDADRIAGYQVDIDYNPAIISVTSVVDADAAGSTFPIDLTIISRIESSGGIGFLSLTDTTTNPNSMTLSAFDGTAIPLSPGNHESGDGVLARVTVTALGAGVTDLDIGGPLGGTDSIPDVLISSGTDAGAWVPVANVQDGKIAVGQPCPMSSDTPTPTPTPTPTATPTATATVTPTPTATAAPGSGVVDLVAVDTTTAGNDDSAIGTIDSCASMNVGETLVFDLIVRGVDDADRIAGYQVDIDYDSAIISVTSVVDADAAGSTFPNDVTMISRIESSGGIDFLSVTDTTTNPNSMTLWAIDGTESPPPPGNHESGEGVLARVSVTAVSAGVTNLDVGGPLGGRDSIPDVLIISGTDFGAPVPVAAVQDGKIAVGQPCPSTTGTFTVNKDFSDDSTASVDVTVTCDNSAIPDPAGATAVTEAAPVEFEITLPGGAATCTATEGVPAGYTADETECLNVAIDAGGTPSCTITNTQTSGCPPTPWPVPPGDDDCDGWTTDDEGSIGTDPSVACDDGLGLPDWPPDFDDSKAINIVDVLALRPVFGSPSVRHDLDASGGNINIIDVLKIRPVFNESCTP